MRQGMMARARPTSYEASRALLLEVALEREAGHYRPA